MPLYRCHFLRSPAAVGGLVGKVGLSGHLARQLGKGRALRAQQMSRAGVSSSADEQLDIIKCMRRYSFASIRVPLLARTTTYPGRPLLDMHAMALTLAPTSTLHLLPAPVSYTHLTLPTICSV